MTDLTNLTNDQLRRMVELLHESGQRLLVACRFLNEGARIDAQWPMNVGVGLRTDAERIRHEPREPDHAAKALADRKTVEEWVKATENARCIEVWSGTNGHHCRLFSSGAGDKRASLVFRSEIHGTQEASFAAAAEWVRGQG